MKVEIEVQDVSEKIYFHERIGSAEVGGTEYELCIGAGGLLVMGGGKTWRLDGGELVGKVALAAIGITPN